MTEIAQAEATTSGGQVFLAVAAVLVAFAAGVIQYVAWSKSLNRVHDMEKSPLRRFWSEYRYQFRWPYVVSWPLLVVALVVFWLMGAFN